MQTLTIRRFDQLRYRQWQRVVATAKRQVRKFTGQPCEIGVGRKFRGERPAGRRISLRVYLPAKRTRVAPSKQIPDPFEIRLRRKDGAYDLLKIQSDVESLARFRPTTGTVVASGGEAISGHLVRWTNPEGLLNWGFLTVAHLFDGQRSIAAQVRISPRVRFQCRRLTLPSWRDRCDVAVLQITESANQIADRFASSGLPGLVDASARRIMSVDEVRHAAISHQRGQTGWTKYRLFLRGRRSLPRRLSIGRSPTG